MWGISGCYSETKSKGKGSGARSGHEVRTVWPGLGFLHSSHAQHPTWKVQHSESRDLGLGFELKLQALVGVCYLSLVAWIRTQSNGRRYVPSPSVAVSSQCNSF